MMLKRIILFIITVVVLLGNSSFRVAPQINEQEYLLKAAFLYRFADYVEWDTNNEETFNIAILGESDILAPLLEISTDKKIKNKKIIVKQYSNINDIGACQLIFVSKNYKYPIENVLSDSKSRLIIAERKDDFMKGAHMNFLIADNKLKFEVNLKTASYSGLKISSNLLQHALVIKR